jgi:hypothetical protein
MHRALWLLVASALASSCAKSAPEKVETHAASARKTTSELVQRPEIAALVDALAAEHRIESQYVGDRGKKSAVYEKFEALAAKATDDELAALLAHPSPVVRGYVAQRIAERVPAHVSDLAALAEDVTMVDTLGGCMLGARTIRDVVLGALRASPLAEAGRVLAGIEQKAKLAHQQP